MKQDILLFEEIVKRLCKAPITKEILAELKKKTVDEAPKRLYSTYGQTFSVFGSFDYAGEYELAGNVRKGRVSSRPIASKDGYYEYTFDEQDVLLSVKEVSRRAPEKFTASMLKSAKKAFAPEDFESILREQEMDPNEVIESVKETYLVERINDNVLVYYSVDGICENSSTGRIYAYFFDKGNVWLKCSASLTTSDNGLKVYGVDLHYYEYNADNKLRKLLQYDFMSLDDEKLRKVSDGEYVYRLWGREKLRLKDHQIITMFGSRYMYNYSEILA